MLDLISGAYNELQFRDDLSKSSLLKTYLRLNILAWACKMHHEDCIRNAVKEYAAWRNSPNPDKNNPISPNLKRLVYCTAIRFGTLDDWTFAWKRYLASNVDSERRLLLMAMSCTREPWLLIRYFSWALNNHPKIKDKDHDRVTKAVASNSIGHIVIINYLFDNWTNIKMR